VGQARAPIAPPAAVAPAPAVPAAVVVPAPAPPPSGPSTPEVERLIQERVGQSRAQIAEEVRRATADLEQRLTAQWNEAAARRGESDDSFRLGLEKRLSEAQGADRASIETLRIELDKRLEASEVRLRAAVATAVGPEIDRRLQTSLEPRLQETLSKLREDQRGVVDAHRQRVADEADRTNAELRERVARAEEELRASLSAQLDLHLREAADRELSVREELEGRLRESTQKRLDEIDAKRLRDQKELDQKLTILVDGRTRDLADRLQKTATELQGRVPAAVDDRIRLTESALDQRFESRANELQTANLAANADLQVRLQGHFDERLREGLDREREKYLELLARLKSEVEGTFARANDPAKLEPLLRERVGRAVDAFRVETQRMVDARVGEAEGKLADAPQDGLRRLEQVEQVLAERETLLEQLEARIRGELDELDHRTQVLSDRLVPVVRKAWLKIAEIQKAPPGAAPSPSPDAELQQVRRDLHREVRRLEAELSEKTTEIRERMETTIANQGRVWLTLVRQLSQLTDDRRALERSKLGDLSWSETEVHDPFAGLDAPVRPAARSASTTPPAVEPSATESADDDDPPADRRRPARRR
jgi:sugar-specific transcriptional regulator TrmB